MKPALLIFFLLASFSAAADQTETKDDALMAGARLQSNLERVAVARDVSGEKIVEAYAAYLKSDFSRMDAVLEEADMALPSLTGQSASMIAEYFIKLDKAVGPSDRRPPLLRLIYQMRKIDAALFLDDGEPWAEDLETRQAREISAANGHDLPQNGLWLMLPCRTVIGRAAEFEAVRRSLGELSGPLLSCPSGSEDFGELESMAEDGTGFPAAAPDIEPPRAVPIPKPEADNDPAAHMGDMPDQSEPLLAKAAVEGSPAAKLDYALFLHGFRPETPARNVKIRSLLAAMAVPEGAKPGDYDGTDRSLLPYITFASSGGPGASYAIPCPVLLARPMLIEAVAEVQSRWGPESGCGSRGAALGFPQESLFTFYRESVEADGHFMETVLGSIVRDLAKSQDAQRDTLIAPHWLLAMPANLHPKLDYPYQNWGLQSRGAYRISQRIRISYQRAHDDLAHYYVTRGLSAADADKAARIGLFNAVWGAECGSPYPPKPSVRQLLLERAPAETIAPFLANGLEDDAGKSCAYADRDPLLLIAVGDPQALPLILDKTTVDVRNPFGKTALMVAAQEDQLESAKLLLVHSAQVNAVTSRLSEHLGNDARTALMYAAANASLEMIKLLLAAGADPYQTDTKGHRAIHYLLGFGPTGANPKLSPEQRAEAARLLF